MRKQDMNINCREDILLHRFSNIPGIQFTFFHYLTKAKALLTNRNMSFFYKVSSQVMQSYCIYQEDRMEYGTSRSKENIVNLWKWSEHERS